MDDGAQIRLSGEGEAGVRGGEQGNLYVVLGVADHPKFERVEDHILFELPVNVAQASLGAKVSIPTLDGDMEFEVPEGTQSGEDFVLRGKGVPTPARRWPRRYGRARHRRHPRIPDG